MAEIWKYVPNRIGIFRRGVFHPGAPVTTVILHPPVSASVHPGTAIRGDWALAEIITPEGTRTYGFADGYITSRLRTAVKLGPGQERDEVVAKWKDAPPPPRSTRSHAVMKETAEPAGYRVAYLVPNPHRREPGQEPMLQLWYAGENVLQTMAEALADLRAAKRRGYTAWIVDEAGRHVPVKGAARPHPRSYSVYGGINDGRAHSTIQRNEELMPMAVRGSLRSYDLTATRDYEYVVYPEASHRHAERAVKIPMRRVRGSLRSYDLTDAKRAAKQMGPPAAIYSVSKGRFVGYIHPNGRYVPFR
jgi:hypothetical protein